METVIMIDGAFIRKKFRVAFKQNITASDLEKAVSKLLQLFNLPEHNYRAYFYDCKPCDVKTSLPISHKHHDFEQTPQYLSGQKLIKETKMLPFFAVREGVLSFQGWTLRQKSYGQNPLDDGCFEPNLKQKGVDIKIGLDVAWVSFNHIAKNIVMITGDSDFIPIIKTARRNGVFVYLLTLGHIVKKELLESADITNESPITSLFRL